MKPYSKQNRSRVACTSCRLSKVKCIKEPGMNHCDRCRSLSLECAFNVKKSQESDLIGIKISRSENVPTTDRNVPLTTSNPRVEVILPSKQYILELVDIFFANQYLGIFPFIHKPTFINFLKSDSFDPSNYMEEYNSKFFTEKYSSNIQCPDPILLLSILALCARLHNEISSIYGDFLEEDSPETYVPGTPNINEELILKNFELDVVLASNASKYFGWHARHYMRDVFDSPTVQRIQAFTLLSSHEWGEGNNSRSFLYIGIAARMALVLGLGNESSINNEEDKVEDEALNQIVIESKRRTIWSVYMMDRCNSSGRERSPAIRVEDIRVRLPSQENEFIFGNPNTCLTYEELYSFLNESSSKKMINLSLRGYTIVLFEIWAKIAKWVGEVGAKHEKSSPWLPGSTFYNLCKLLDNLNEKIPQNYRFSDFNLRLHMELGSATHYGYFHGLYFISRIFLNREYLFCNPKSFPEGWWAGLTDALLISLENISSLIQQLRKNKMMVIAPFTGFEVFTSVVTSFYFCTFPNEILMEQLPLNLLEIGISVDDLEQWKFKYKALAVENLDALKVWRNAWELGRNWHDLSINLASLFNQLANYESDVISSEYLRHSMQDYGNGKVREVYTPKKSINNEKSSMDILKLLNNEDILGRQGSSKQGPPTSDQEFGDLEFLPAPQFLHGKFYDSSSIYPGWNDSGAEYLQI